MKFIRKLIVVLILFTLSFSCKDFSPDILTGNEFRIKRITELNEYGEEIVVQTFTYEKNKLIFWRTYYYDDVNELQASRKVEVKYNGNTINALQFKKVNAEWKAHQSCSITVQNNLVKKKLISRKSFPECENCWKYNYEYIGSNLQECSKFIKDELGNWNQLHRQLYTYRNSKPFRYESFVEAENGTLRLDYIRNYTIINDEITGWEGGICVNGDEWQPTQKMEYFYEGDVMSTMNYFISTGLDTSWNFFGKVDYLYDIDYNLIEEIFSNGSSIEYEYEAGKGNASLIYCEPNETSGPEPNLKKATAIVY